MSAPAVAIVEHGGGNLGSLRDAVEAAGVEVLPGATAAQLARAPAILLPGVGAFAAMMSRLRARGLDEAVLDAVRAGTPLLGICVGMQVLADLGREHEEARGLGLVAGSVEAIPAAPGIRIPHMGWNEVEPRVAHPAFEGIPAGTSFYFAHSFAFRPVDRGAVVAETEHGGPVVAAVARGSVIGVQFHPEKSGRDGLRLLGNFARWAA